MKKIAFGVVGAAVVLGVGGLATSYYVGGRIEQTMQEEIQKINAETQGMVHVEVLAYDRGVIRSQAKTNWVVSAEGDSVQFTLNHNILQGPWAMGKAAKIVSHIQFSEPVQAQVMKAFKEQEPLVWTAWGQWSGASEHTLTSPAVSTTLKDDASITWGGMDAKWDLSADRTTNKGFLSMPEISISDASEEDSGSFSLKKTDITFDATKPQSHQLWLGTSALKIAEMTLEEKSKDFAAQLQDIRFQSTSSMQGALVNMTTTSSIAKLQAPDLVLENIVFNNDINNISAKWLDEFMAIASAHGDELESQLQALHTSLPELLANQPEISIPRFSFVTTDGPVELSARAVYIGKTPFEYDLTNDMQAMIHLKIPQKLVTNLLTSQIKQRLAANSLMLDEDGNEDAALLESEAQRLVNLQLQQILQHGILQKNEDAYVAELETKEGKLLLNQKEINPMQLLGIAGAF